LFYHVLVVFRAALLSQREESLRLDIICPFEFGIRVLEIVSEYVRIATDKFFVAFVEVKVIGEERINRNMKFLSYRGQFDTREFLLQLDFVVMLRYGVFYGNIFVHD
jgi:hypothetical protein